MSRPQITFSIPVYNDDKTIEKLVSECIAVGDQFQFDYQILIIEDGSSDDSVKTVAKLCGQHSFIRAVYHEVNMSFGPTLREVFTLPDTEWICFLPGDHQFHAHDMISVAVEHMNSSDYILGRRIERADSLWRKIVSLVYNTGVSLISGTYVQDVNSAVLFRREIADYKAFKGDSAFVHAELFLMATQGGFRVKEVPVKHNKRLHGKAGGNTYKVISSTFLDLMRCAIGR